MAKPNRKKNMHKMPEPMPLGEILTDNSKEEWELGPSIGKGGFGEIYSAKRVLSEKSNVSYVIKIVSDLTVPSRIYDELLLNFSVIDSCLYCRNHIIMDHYSLKCIFI